MKTDLHIHTSFSVDGMSSPKEIIKSAIEKDIKCICITDHGTLEGAIEAMKAGFDKDILVLPGIEILSESGDILGINIRKKIPDRLSAEETILRIKRQNGLAVIPHPFGWPFMGFLGGEEKIQMIRPDAVESFNSFVSWNGSNKRALAFSKENNFSFTAGSDAHRAEFIGRGYIEIMRPVLSEQDVISSILEKKIKIGGNPLNFIEIAKNISMSKKNMKNIIIKYLSKKFQKSKLFRAEDRFFEKGFSLYFSVLILAIILAVVLGLTAILVGQLKMMRAMEYSVAAFHAAETGGERALYEISSNELNLQASYSGDLGESDYVVYIFCCHYDSEKCEFVEAGGGGTVCPSNLPNPIMGESDYCEATRYCVRSIGTSRGTKRTIEIKIEPLPL